MKTGIGGRLGPVRGGASTRGFGIGLGPFSVGSSWGETSGAMGLFVRLVALAVLLAAAVALAVVAGFVYGVVLIWRGIATYRANDPERSTSPLALVCVGAVLVTVCSVLGVWGVRGLQVPDRTQVAAQAAAAEGPLVLPNVVGGSLDQAWGALNNLRAEHPYTKIDVVERDVSPLARKPDSAPWVVEAVDPAPGTVLSAGATVTVYVLRDSEHAWFAAHKTFPKLPPGMETSMLTFDGGPLRQVWQLVQLRYAPGVKLPADDAIAGARTPSGSPQPPDPLGLSTPSAVEAQALARPEPESDYDIATVATVPKEGQPLRLGQAIVVYVRPT